ncbi:MAG: SPASM domain-containing protein [Candidatus Muirbacterium halophilum]|nr:SPASM domain-containing protein [Candidatus Muirbacterium halophilum]MCK9474309.1 SPASM domain-containing protein [Candidatus Muirbacterium halophilum]
MKKKFKVVYVEITDNCNLSCFFCPVDKKKQNNESFRKMELYLFDKVCSQISPLTDKMTYHILGEPLFVDDLANYLDISKKYGLKVIITTNGTLVDEKFDVLLHDSICLINISVTSVIPNNIDINSYFDKIFLFMEKYHKIRPKLYFNLRLWNYNNSEKNETINQQFIDLVNNRLNIILPNYIQLNGRKSVKVNDYIYLNYDNMFEFPDANSIKVSDNGRCHGLDTHFGILADGTVIPCCLDYSATIALGNIKNNTIDDILNSERSKNILCGFKKGKLVENTCKKCDFIKRFK